MIEQGITNSFLRELFSAVHDFGLHPFKMALYTSAADIGKNTTSYTTAGEVPAGLGYTTGGVVLTGITVSLDTALNVAYVSFNSPEWPNASFTARGALIYNDFKQDRSVVVLDFGDDKNAGGKTFRATVPANTASTAIIRLVRGQ